MLSPTPIKYHLEPDLPRLAWLLRIQPGLQVDLWHGPWVETWPTGFAAGIWNDDYRSARPDEASVMVGTAGRTTPDGLILSAPSDSDQYLAAARLPEGLFWSNSLAFLLTRTADALDIAQPYYITQFLKFYRLGRRQLKMEMRTRDRTVQLYKLCSPQIDAALHIHLLPKSRTPTPSNFNDHESFLLKSMQDVFANAAHPARSRPYTEIVASISRGYDSAAVAALARQLGVQEGLTFNEKRSDGSMDRSDDGSEIGGYLGYRMHALDRMAYQALPNLSELEFCTNFENGMHAPIAAAEALVAGKILLRGDWGDRVWSLTPYANMPDWLLQERFHADGGSQSEFSLRTGCLFFPVPKLGMDQLDRLHQISRSAEMAPWQVPGDYNRPIPRRILETAGVPRQAFGQQKSAGGHINLHQEPFMRPEIWQGLQAFLADQQVPADFGGRPRWTLARAPGLAADRLYTFIARAKPVELRLWLRPVILPLLYFERLWRDTDQRGRTVYLFHWAMEAIRSRYE
jgi:hypothetical protein